MSRPCRAIAQRLLFPRQRTFNKHNTTRAKYSRSAALVLALNPGILLRSYKMKKIAVFALLCAISGSASAQALECQPTPRAGDLLACYNRTATPLARHKRATSKITTTPEKSTVSMTPTDQRAQADDLLDDENKKLDTKLKTLCRGC